MTPNEIRALRGCQLDEAVAVVLGWRPEEYGEMNAGTLWRRPDGSLASAVPAFSTDPAALQVAKGWMRTKGWGWSVESPSEAAGDMPQDRAFWAIVWPDYNDYEAYSTENEGIALCIALLLAHYAEQEQSGESEVAP